MAASSVFGIATLSLPHKRRILPEGMAKSTLAIFANLIHTNEKLHLVNKELG
jgi:hypothetical protein